MVLLAPRRTAATLRLLGKIEDIEDHEVLFIIYGQMVEDDAAEELVSAINEKYPDIEVGLIKGQQDVYDLLIGLF